MTTLDATLRELVREAVRDAVREALPELLKSQVQPNEFLTVAEAAGARKVTPATIRSWIRAGRLPTDGTRPYRILRRDLTSVGSGGSPAASEVLVKLLPTLKR